MAYRTDKPDFPGKTIYIIIMARAISKGLPHIRRKPRKFFPKDPKQLLLRHPMKFFSHSNRHHLNKPHMHLMIPGQKRHLTKILIRNPKRHTVNLQRNLRILQRFRNPLKGPSKFIPPGDPPAAGLIQRIQTDIQSVQSRPGKIPHLIFQKHTICSQSHLLDPRHIFQFFHKLGHPRPHQRFSASQLDLSDPQLCHHPADPQNFLFLQNEGALHMLHSLLRHTINTPQITSVSYGNPEIINISSAPVYHFSSKRKSPLFPPVFSSRWISDMTMRLSIALHIS